MGFEEGGRIVQKKMGEGVQKKTGAEGVREGARGRMSRPAILGDQGSRPGVLERGNVACVSGQHSGLGPASGLGK